MKETILWISTALLATAFAYTFLRGTPGSDGVGTPVAELTDRGGDFEDGDTLAEISKKTGPSRGIASFYGVGTNGTTTASGIPLNDSVSTAAHRTLPFGTLVRVTNLRNGLSETVTITDRGPFLQGRIIDVSRNAAKKLDMIQSGIVSVEIEVLPKGAKPRKPQRVAN